MNTYQGRPLPRPGEDVVDQGLAFDLATLRRRQALRVFGLGAVALGLGGCGRAEDTTASTGIGPPGEIPDETAGPYPGDGSNGPNVLTGSGVIRRDITSSFGTATGRAAGVPMTLTLSLKDLANAGAAYAGPAVYVWHCDRAGAYSLYSEGVTGENYLRGVQIADDAGEVTFTSIFPACYTGRWPHVHFEVYPDQASITDASKAIATSQVALPRETCDEVYQQTGYESSVTNLAQVSLDSDNVFGEDSGALQLATVTGTPMSGLVVTLEVGVDTTTTPTGGQLSGDGAPSGAPPSGGPGAPGGAPPSR
ncbi:dioxygenase family protein [Actinoplanes xinjiangensis]|uniref:Dioxygenase-like protein n=1 Tax=Actinoplanes xinjiangensis TaxID=512350 RepID=A0A316F8W5_9ACTN|nr:3,4-dioxygenase subunit beta [Actinoplanes xinjiangensis]PWK44149.1 dioxygenase-like protein [Actinoplanes xinjiangensis]GIF38095.1 3,4-dioxygenase subunit beta [Actinoplanes xinjiangensis]